MNKEQKATQKAKNTQLRKEKKQEINRRKKSERESDLLDCPFDVEMNGRYGTCTCGGENRESCAGDI